MQSKGGLSMRGGLAAQRFLCAALFGPCLVLLFPACDSIPAVVLPNDDTTLVTEPSDAPDPGAGDVITAAGVTNSTAKIVAIQAAPVFCCNPLSYDLEVQLGDGQSDQGVRFEWDFGDGRAGSGRTVQHTFGWPGTYPVRVTAHLPGGTSETVITELTVGGTSAPPSPAVVELRAVAGPDREVAPGETVVLDGTLSKGPRPRDLRFRWRQISGPTVSLEGSGTNMTSFVAPEPDREVDTIEFGFELIVSDMASTASDVVTVRVVRRPDPIVVADAGPDQQVNGSDTVVLDGTASRGTGSRPLAFEWTQTAGPTVALAAYDEPLTTFTAPEGGSRPIYLTFEFKVTQGTLSAKDSVDIVVAPLPTSTPVSDEQVLEWLRELSPLPKVHYSWPMPAAKFSTFSEDLLREYARITHSLCVWGEWIDQQGLNKAASVAWQVNSTNPDTPVTLGLVFRPWTRVFPPTAPPTYVGPEHEAEIDLFVNRLATVRQWVEQANLAHYWDPIEVSAVILECERFNVKQEGETGSAEWNAAITAKQNAIYLAAKAAFPQARVEWYNRGISDLFTLNEGGDAYSAPLYYAPERLVMRTTFRRAYESAVEHGVEDVTPWVSLGTAYVRQPDGSAVWSFDYDYDLIYSWHIGAEINDSWFGDRPEQFAPWHAAKVVVFWPPPWDDRVPNWPRHFVSYVRGAFNITQLPR